MITCYKRISSLEISKELAKHIQKTICKPSFSISTYKNYTKLSGEY